MSAPNAYIIPNRRSAAARVGVLTSRSQTPPDRIDEARTDLVMAQFAETVREHVARIWSAPKPLTPEQKAALAGLLDEAKASVQMGGAD
jgi:hypothetical protein